MYNLVIKRFLDFFLSLIGILVLAFPMLCVAIVTKIDSPGPAFFRQKRVGRGKRPFYLLKFRSMSVSAPKDVPTHRLQNATELMTPWQRFMRKYSIDELPQLLSVLSGKMSIVGPRPALENQTDLIAERDRYRANDVRPGLTGLAQISGRDRLTLKEKARLDGEYVAALRAGCLRGIAIDARCFFGTFGAVLRSDGVVEGATEESIKETQNTEGEQMSESAETQEKNKAL